MVGKRLEEEGNECLDIFSSSSRREKSFSPRTIAMTFKYKLVSGSNMFAVVGTVREVYQSPFFTGHAYNSV